MSKPTKKERLLVCFHITDKDLNKISAELDTFDGKKEPERCNRLVNKLRKCQDKVINCVQNLVEYYVENPVTRDYRRKFPEDIIHDGLYGQLWFGAECLSAGSSIMNREIESAAMRPLARSFTKQVELLRVLLRDCKKNIIGIVIDALTVFDRLFAEFELNYVSAMVVVKSVCDYDALLDLVVLMSESTNRAIKIGLLSQEMLDAYEPKIMFAIPRLAIIAGLVHFPNGALLLNKPAKIISMFRPYVPLFKRLSQLLNNMDEEEIWHLEQTLCDTTPTNINCKIDKSIMDWKENEICHFQSTDKKVVTFITDSLKECLISELDNDTKQNMIENTARIQKINAEKQDLLHRLFLCISSIADQLQSNYASDMRYILECVFKINSDNDGFQSDHEDDSRVTARNEIHEAPRWIPDEEISKCTKCQLEFNFFRRRHHCRNCGLIYCSACSSHSLPLFHYGFKKPVRVCGPCFQFQASLNS